MDRPPLSDSFAPLALPTPSASKAAPGSRGRGLFVLPFDAPAAAPAATRLLDEVRRAFAADCPGQALPLLGTLQEGASPAFFELLAVLIAQARLVLGQFSCAKAALDAACTAKQADPDPAVAVGPSPSWWMQRALVLSRLGALEEAEAAATIATAPTTTTIQNDADGEVFFVERLLVLADVVLQRHGPAAALAPLARVLDVSPSNGTALARRTGCLYLLGEDAAAATAWEAFNAGADDGVAACLDTAFVFGCAGDPQTALSALVAAGAQAPLTTRAFLRDEQALAGVRALQAGAVFAETLERVARDTGRLPAAAAVA